MSQFMIFLRFSYNYTDFFTYATNISRYTYKLGVVEMNITTTHSHFYLNPPLLAKLSARRHARSETILRGFGGYAVPKFSG